MTAPSPRSYTADLAVKEPTRWVRKALGRVSGSPLECRHLSWRERILYVNF